MPRVLAPDESLPHKLAAALRIGEVIAVPTDTTYALVTALSSKKGVERLKTMRRLGPDRPVTLLLSDTDEIGTWAKIDRPAYRLIRRLTPGPFTFLLPAMREVGKYAESNRRVIGVRIPDHDFVRALACEVARENGSPLASASAARLPPRVGEGEPMPDDLYLAEAAEIDSAYPDCAAIVDFGPLPPEVSTVVDLTGGDVVILRQGAGRLA